MISIAIVEDQKEYADYLVQGIHRFEEEEGVKFSIDVFSDGMSFLDECDRGFQIVFMDIVMPHMNGVDAARALREKDKNVCIIFLTNMRQYAIKGYEVDAMDFLVKPVSPELLKTKLKKAVGRVSSDTYYTISVPNGIRREKLSNIDWIESDKHYLNIHTGGETVRTRSRMSDVTELFEKNHFVLISHSVLINLAKVDTAYTEEVTVAGQKFPIAKAYRKSFWEKLNLYLGGGV